MRRNKVFLGVAVIIFLSIVAAATNFTSIKTKNVSAIDSTEKMIAELKKSIKEEIIAEIKEPVKKEIKLKNSIKLKYKLVNDSKDRVYSIMYFRDLAARHNVGIGYEYTDTKKDKRAILIEYTYKF